MTSVDSTLPEIRVHRSQTELAQTEPAQTEPAQTELARTQPAREPEPDLAAAPEFSEVRRYLLARGNSALADRLFKVLMLVCALSIFVIVALIAYQLIDKSQL